MKTILVLTIILFAQLFFSGHTFAGNIYKCTVNGKTIFQQFKCDDSGQSEILDIVQNDYSDPKWLAVDARIEVQKEKDRLREIKQQKDFEQRKQADIERVERINNHKWRQYRVAQRQYEEQQRQQRHQDRMTNLETLANLALYGRIR